MPVLPKRANEFVAGDLRDPHRAVVPVAAAVGGMIVPAVLYLAIAGGTGPKGWAVPAATDIAFALAVLAVISTHLPDAFTCTSYAFLSTTRSRLASRADAPPICIDCA